VLINVYGLASGGKRDRIDKIDSKGKLTIEFAVQDVMYFVGVFLSESVNWNN
jgi:hypothetical protein